jgi:uncharacterized membrane protein
MQHNEFIDKLDDGRIVEAISAAEAKSSGEIRVFVSRQRPGTENETIELAKKAFERLGMTRTRQRNGVLLFFAPMAQRFAVIGDVGIHEKCAVTFWQEIAQTMSLLLKQGDFTSAVLAGVRETGQLLAQNFPGGSDDRNELPNTVERD